MKAIFLLASAMLASCISFHQEAPPNRELEAQIDTAIFLNRSIHYELGLYEGAMLGHMYSGQQLDDSLEAYVTRFKTKNPL